MVDDSDINVSRVNSDVRPIPDPTVLTNQLVITAVRAQRETFDAKIAAIVDKQEVYNTVTTRHTDLAAQALREHFATKIEGLEQSMLQRVAALTETVAVLKTTVNERFTQGDVQTEKAARDVKSAVDAAFAAAKEAVGEQNKSNALSIAKSEVATTKQIDQLSENLRISVKNTDDKIDGIKNNFDDKYTDLKDRVVAMEARGSVIDPSTERSLNKLIANVENLASVRDQGVGHRGGTTDSMSMIGWIVGIIGVVFAVIEAVTHFGAH